MKNVSLLSLPETATWKAKGYRLGSPAYGQPQAVEALPGATWDRVDVFGSYETFASGPPPHTAFLRLRELRMSRGKHEVFDRALQLFVREYGLLGLYNETFFSPILPAHAGPFAFIAPDTVLDEWGRLQPVEPATEGKERLEALMRKQLNSERRLGPVVRPDELRFASPRHTPFGPMGGSLTGAARSPTLSWEEVREFYGVRAVLDEESASGVSFLSTREPLTAWDLQIEDFSVPPCTVAHLNSHMWGATPHAVRDEKSGQIRQSWRCTSLLQAMYLMLFMDQTGDVDIRKCQAPGCPEYFRVVPGTERRKPRMYCPHPDDPKKRSRCAGRVESKKYRERKRGKS